MTCGALGRAFRPRWRLDARRDGSFTGGFRSAGDTGAVRTGAPPHSARCGGEPGAPLRRAWAPCRRQPRRPRRPTVYAPSMDSGAIGIFFFPPVPLMNAVLRAADAARAVGRQDLDARISPELTHRSRGPGRRPHGREGGAARRPAPARGACAASRIRSPCAGPEGGDGDARQSARVVAPCRSLSSNRRPRRGRSARTSGAATGSLRATAW